VHNFKYNYSKVIYKTSSKKVTIICKEHGKFKQIPHNHLKGNGCPSCRKSRGEILISNWLQTNNIQYTPNKTFPNCKNKRLLSFDFYLKKYNLLIEFQGQQHYSEISYFSNDRTYTRFLRQVKHDSIKKKFYKINNISLLCIPYWEIKNIPTILDKWINKKSKGK